MLLFVRRTPKLYSYFSKKPTCILRQRTLIPFRLRKDTSTNRSKLNVHRKKVLTIKSTSHKTSEQKISYDKTSQIQNFSATNIPIYTSSQLQNVLNTEYPKKHLKLKNVLTTKHLKYKTSQAINISITK
jgi:hypothetical protein